MDYKLQVLLIIAMVMFNLLLIANIKNKLENYYMIKGVKW